MAGAGQPRVSVRVVSGNLELFVRGSRYTTEPPTRIQSTVDLAQTLQAHVGNAIANGQQFSLTPGDPARGPAQWVVTPRGAGQGSGTTVGGQSRPGETPLAAAMREFEEETGSTLAPGFFTPQQDPNEFLVRVVDDDAARNRFIANWNDLQPATETWQMQWGPPTKRVPTLGGQRVTLADIRPAAITQLVLAEKARLNAPGQGPVGAGAGAGAPAQPQFPAANPGETQNDYVDRVAGRDVNLRRLARAHAKTLKLTGGRRKTYRRRGRGKKKTRRA